MVKADPLAQKRAAVVEAMLIALPGRDKDSIARDVEAIHDEASLDRLLDHYQTLNRFVW
jgi:hypothetical protein